jgi:hypothetical protein
MMAGSWLINMHWMVLNLSDASHTLLTCDRPYTSSHGFGDRAAMVGVPISPRHLFVAANDPAQRRVLDAQRKTDTVRNANSLMTQLAVENVYGSLEKAELFHLPNI